MKYTLRIVTRKSLLALWQAEFVKQKLIDLHPSLNVSLITVSTEGDKHLDVSLAKLGGKGLFVKELEEALLRNEADIAVHSMKDVPSVLPEGLKIASVLERIDPRDAFVSNHYDSLDSMPAGSVIGTSSLRREAQVLRLRSDLKVKALRGNVDTHLNKLDKDEFDAIILAAAGLERLGFEHRIREIFHPNVMLPGIGQGALGIECRSADQKIEALVSPLHHIESGVCLAAERSMNQVLGGSCQSPIGGFATIENIGKNDVKDYILNKEKKDDIDKRLKLKGMVASRDGKQFLFSEGEFNLNTFEKVETLEDTVKLAVYLGKEVADDLLKQGAKQIIK